MRDPQLEDIISALKSLNRKMDQNQYAPTNDGRAPGDFYRDRRIDSDGDQSKSADDVIKAYAKSKKAIEDVNSAHKKVFSSMLDGIPVVKQLVETFKSSSDIIERSTRGQSDAYRESAKAVADFADKAGASSSDLEKVNATMARVQESTEKLGRTAKNKQKLEEELVEAFKDTVMHQATVAEDLSDVQDLIKQAKAKAKSARSDKNKNKLNNAVAVLEQLATIPIEVAKIKKEVSDKEFNRIVSENAELEPMLEKLEELIDKTSSLKNIEDRLETISDVNERTSAGVMAAKASNELAADKADKRSQKLEGIMNNLSKSIAGALGEAIGKEAGMFMLRQQMTGSAFDYSARMRAIEMGMGEGETLTALASDRFLIRKIAQESELGTGAGDLLESGELNRLRTMMRDLGFVNKEGLDQLLKISETLRVSGAELSEENIRSMVSFIGKTFKDIGLTPEQMAQTIGEFTREGMLRTMAAGPDARFASVEAMEQEIAFRTKLARTLNQEIDLQKKRVQQLAGLAYGDPVEAFKKSIGIQLLGKQAGFGSGELQMLGEFIRTGGKSNKLSEDQKTRAKLLYEDVLAGTGGILESAAGTGAIGVRAMTTQFLGIAGESPFEAVDSYARRRGERRTPTDFMGREIVNTERPMMELSNTMNTAVDVIEHGTGVLKSAIGNSAAATVSAIKDLIPYIVAGSAGSILGGRGGKFGKAAKGFGGKLMRNARIGGPAAIVGMGANAFIPEDSAAKPLGYAAAGAGMGMMLGLPGAAAGGVLGLGYGLVTGAEQSAIQNSEQRSLERQRAFGGYGGEGMEAARASFIDSETSRIMQVREEFNTELAKDAPDVNKLNALSAQMEVSSNPAARSILENIEHVEELKKTEKSRQTGMFDFMLGNTAGTQIEDTPEITATRAEISRDLTQFVEEDRHKGIAEPSVITSMIEELKTNDIEEKEGIIGTLETWLERIRDASEGTKEAIEAGNEEVKKNYAQMNEMELRAQIEATLSGTRTGAMNASFGALQNYSR